MSGITTSLTISLTLLLFTPCGTMVKGIANKLLSEKKGVIPPKLGKEISTMLSITHHNSYNKYLKKNVKKLYAGSYQFLSKDKFETEGNYNDLDKYKFLLDYSEHPAGTKWESKTGIIQS